MGKYDNIKEKIMRVPTANDISPDKLQSFLKHYGFEIKHVNGSHYIYAYKGTGKTFMLNIPMHNPVKPTYIDQVRQRIKEIEEE
jgi:predicted RNA binding protein YcfA (HicA-like mRNA interferase family)